MAETKADRFIPATMARSVGDGVFFRPVRSWHSATYAGEKIIERSKGGDRSGCMFADKFHGLEVCSIPYTVTHRLYWHERDQSKTISVFLSYPGAMGYCDGYFWEALMPDADDVTRYSGDEAETDMEAAVKAALTTTHPNTARE